MKCNTNKALLSYVTSFITYQGDTKVPIKTMGFLKWM